MSYQDRHQLVPILISQNEEAPIGADLNMTVSLIKMNKEAPIGADFDLTISLIITEGIGMPIYSF